MIYLKAISALFIITLYLTGCSCSLSDINTDQSFNKNSSGDVLEEKVKNENFGYFYEKFYTDSLFQLSRIKFPLPGINTDDQDVDENETYYWQKEKWQLHHMPDKKNNDSKITKSDNVVIEEITNKAYPGLIIKSQFKRIDGKWFLIYFVDVNL